jgi:DNA-nicking Smr family endonuclease
MAKLIVHLDRKTYTIPEVEAEVRNVIAETIEKKIVLLELVVGKENPELKKQVLRFLVRPEIKKLYFKTEVNHATSGRILIRFRHNRDKEYH